MLHSYRLGVTCPYTPGAERRALLLMAEDDCGMETAGVTPDARLLRYRLRCTFRRIEVSEKAIPMLAIR